MYSKIICIPVTITELFAFKKKILLCLFPPHLIFPGAHCQVQSREQYLVTGVSLLTPVSSSSVTQANKEGFQVLHLSFISVNLHHHQYFLNQLEIFST